MPLLQLTYLIITLGVIKSVSQYSPPSELLTPDPACELSGDVNNPVGASAISPLEPTDVEAPGTCPGLKASTTAPAPEFQGAIVTPAG